MEEIINEYSHTLKNSNTHLSAETLAIYNNLKFQLSEEELKFVESHLNSCSKCMSAFQQIIDEDIEIDPDASVDKNLFNIGRLVKYSIAASVLITIGFSIYFLSVQQPEKILLTEQVNNKESKVNESIIDTIKTETLTVEQTDKIVEDEFENNQELYSVNIVLENFIERKVRAKSKVSELLPPTGTKLSIPINFEFEVSDVNNSIEFILVNNKNETILSKTINENNYVLNQKLKKGLYYWKIKVDGKVEAISKFLI